MKLREIYFGKAADVPNSRLPVLLYRSVLAPHTASKAVRFRHHFSESGWKGVWADTIYDYTHFHSNAHEVLGIAEGTVALRLGGENGSLFRLKPGDMLVIPAGVGHRRVGSDEGLKVIRAYPRGQSHYDVKKRGRAFPAVALPSADPFYGTDGPLMKAWRVIGRESLRARVSVCGR